MKLTIKTAEDLQAEAKRAASDKIKSRRNQAISSGITVSGVPIATDDLSQSRIMGAALAASLDPATTVKWRGAGGTFATLDAATIITIAQATRAHVQACFDREAELQASLTAGEAYDLNEGWP